MDTAMPIELSPRKRIRGIHRLEAAADAQLHAVGIGLEETRCSDGVLRVHRLLHGLQRQAQRRQLGVGQLDPDFFFLQPDQVDLGHVLDAVQVELDALGVILHGGVVEAFAIQCVDVAESVAEFIVVEGTDDARGQRVPCRLSSRHRLQRSDC